MLLFAALSDRTRRDIVGRLSAGEATVKELAEPYAMSMQAAADSGARAVRPAQPGAAWTDSAMSAGTGGARGRALMDRGEPAHVVRPNGSAGNAPCRFAGGSGPVSDHDLIYGGSSARRGNWCGTASRIRTSLLSSGAPGA